MKNISLFLDSLFTRKDKMSLLCFFQSSILDNLSRSLLLFALCVANILFGINSAQAETDFSSNAIKIITIHSSLKNKAKSVTQFGITWTFDKEYEVGTFANGDYWVLGPVKIIQITPESVSGDRIMNGSMLNPMPGKMQGFDNTMYSSYAADYYDNTLNVALNISQDNPLIVAANNSLVSSISLASAGSLPQLKSAAILTVLGTIPKAGSFRPAYTGTDKTIYYNKNDLDYSQLTTLPAVDNMPTISTLTDKLEKPWIDHVGGWLGRYMHPVENMPDYGRDMAFVIGDAAQMLMLDFTDKEKELLLIRLVQLGIDFYGIARDGGKWGDDGGHNHGRKLPILLAGKVLNNNDLINKANGTVNFIFQEDRQTWFVNNDDVGRVVLVESGTPRETYSLTHVGLPEWGEKHINSPKRDDSRWEAKYRKINGSSIIGHTLTARLLDAESLWNWPPVFAYSDRYWGLEKNNIGSTNDMTSFTRSMWQNYSECAKTNSCQ